MKRNIDVYHREVEKEKKGRKNVFFGCLLYYTTIFFCRHFSPLFSVFSVQLCRDDFLTIYGRKKVAAFSGGENCERKPGTVSFAPLMRRGQARDSTARKKRANLRENETRKTTKMAECVWI